MPDQNELYFLWEVHLTSSPELMWELVADTDRLNHDLGYSEIKLIPQDELINNRKQAQQLIFNRLVQEWVEEPFQWVFPYYYSTLRNYRQGIFQYIRQHLRMTEQSDGRTLLMYELWVLPRYAILRGAIKQSFQNMSFDRVFKEYDAFIQLREEKKASMPLVLPFLPEIAIQLDTTHQTRLNVQQQTLIDSGIDSEISQNLVELLRTADDLSLMTIRPYELADRWQIERRQVLEACLLATRIGLLDMSWDLLCPLCRGAKASVSSLDKMTQVVHCEVCHIDYEANFEESVELTFTPNASIRDIKNVEFCVGGPEVTPHIRVQQLLQPGESRTFIPKLVIGRYRVRTMSSPGGQFFRVMDEGVDAVVIRANDADGWQNTESTVQPLAAFTLTNETDKEQLFVMEHLSWSDQAVTAADVTTRQVFRDLFSSEALRPNDQISIGSLTIVFTDLRGSTQMYQEIGDAPAFGLVMEHFDILRESIRKENGAIVKTIGDAVMAVFQQPENAVRAMLNAQNELAKPETAGHVLTLRVGIHTGRCIAVTLNDRLDYFGTTINKAARLEGLSGGGDIILSNDVYSDPAVLQFLQSQSGVLFAESFQAQLKGFSVDDELWRLVPLQMKSSFMP